MSGQPPEARPTPEPGSGDASGREPLGDSAAEANGSPAGAVAADRAEPVEADRAEPVEADRAEPARDRADAKPDVPSSFDGFGGTPVGGDAKSYLPEAGTGPDARIVAIVVTHKRRELLAESLKVLTSQSRPVDHLIVVHNGNEPEVAELVEQQPVATTYLGSAHNLGGAGGFALGMLHALTLGADWVWLADDDGRT